MWEHYGDRRKGRIWKEMRNRKRWKRKNLRGMKMGDRREAKERGNRIERGGRGKEEYGRMRWIRKKEKEGIDRSLGKTNCQFTLI
jgi:hypothetical protein